MAFPACQFFLGEGIPEVNAQVVTADRESPPVRVPGDAMTPTRMRQTGRHGASRHIANQDDRLASHENADRQPLPVRVERQRPIHSAPRLARLTDRAGRQVVDHHHPIGPQVGQAPAIRAESLAVDNDGRLGQAAFRLRTGQRPEFH